MSEVNFVAWSGLLAAVKTRLEAIVHPGDPGLALFERVEFHENQRLGEALRALVISKQRVALIVPDGEDFRTERDGRAVIVERQVSFDVLVADRAWTKEGHAAVFGGAQNVGVLRMSELVRDALLQEPDLGLGGFVAIAPTASAQITVADKDVKDVPGRECWVLSWETPAGEARYSVAE